MIKSIRGSGFGPSPGGVSFGPIPRVIFMPSLYEHWYAALIVTLFNCLCGLLHRLGLIWFGVFLLLRLSLD